MKARALILALVFLCAFGVAFARPPAPGNHGWCIDECTGPYLFVHDNAYVACRAGGGGVTECEIEAWETADDFGAWCYDGCTGTEDCGWNPWC